MYVYQTVRNTFDGKISNFRGKIMEKERKIKRRGGSVGQYWNGEYCGYMCEPPYKREGAFF